MLARLTLPSPDQGVWYLGPFPLRAYALCIIAGIVVAVWLGERRWVARGGAPGQVADIAIWAVPFGIVGGRLYHVVTDNGLYFGDGADPVSALYIWQGGLGIWGAVALGGVGAWIGARRAGMSFLPLADALAPGIVLAQAIGRWGNWFNQELFGRPSDLPWALEIDPDKRPDGYTEFATFHPTFLYECLWNLGVAGLLLWADRRFRLGYGRVFALYVAGYCAGRGWIEYLRIDPVEADDVLGLRLNVWTSIVLFTLAVGYFVWSSRRHPGREEWGTIRIPPGPTSSRCRLHRRTPFTPRGPVRVPGASVPGCRPTRKGPPCTPPRHSRRLSPRPRASTTAVTSTTPAVSPSSRR